MSNFLRNLQIDFQSSYTRLQFFQERRNVPLSPHHNQHVLSLEFLIFSILIGERWNFMAVWIYNSMITKDLEHFLGAS